MIDAALARRIKLVGFDVDGVLTDGGIYLGAVDDRRLEFKRYDIQDGIGMQFLARVGIRLAIVTGRVSDSVRLRARELGIKDVAQDPDAMKLAGLWTILEKRKIDVADVAYVGDDFPDLPILRVVGMPVAVGNAVPEIRDLCSVRLTRHGGRGAIREFAEMLLKARGQWDEAWNGYVEDRSKTPPRKKSGKPR
jgi:3-deoxy-D-manno-octulosonate 8-phosphate phosphatase (KDO 8-P phosphatase)